MTWQKIAYGTLVAGGLAVTGSLVWDSARQKVLAVDFIELFQATQERCLATQYDSGTNIVTVTTNKINLFENDDSTAYRWVSEDGVTNKYKAFSGTSNEVITATNFMHSYYYGIYLSPYRVAPMSISKSYYTATPNQYIWGGYSNYVVAGIESGLLGGLNFNGTYLFMTRTVGPVRMADGDGAMVNAVVDEYWKNGTDSSTRLLDYGPLMGEPFLNSSSYGSCGLCASSSGFRYFTRRGDCVRYGPWERKTTLYGSASNLTITASVLCSNLLRGAWVVAKETQVNAIDRIISGTKMLALSNKIRELIENYVDDTKANGGGEFVDCTNSIPVMTGTGVWTRLDINNNCTNTIFGDEVYTNGALQLLSVVKASNWVDRAKVLYALKWTHTGDFKDSYSDGLTWTAGGVTNCYEWYGVSTNSWGAAKNNCFTSSPSKYIQDKARPYRGTRGLKSKGFGEVVSYHAYAVTRGANLVVATTTQVQHSIDYYLKAKTYGEGSYSNSVFISDGHTLATNALKLCFTHGNTSAGVISNADFFDVSFPAGVWCSEPETNRSESAGFEIILEDAVLKWDFDYCTSSP